MEVRFVDDDLDRLEVDHRFRSRLPVQVVKGFRKAMNYIRAAVDERDLRNWPGGHYEKMRADETGLCSLRLTGQWRLLFDLEGKSPNKRVAIYKIKDYH